MIFVDWGTTNLRAYRLAADGSVAARTQAERGVKQVPKGGFGTVLGELLAPFRASGAGALPVLMIGMVGSRQGWIEVPYRECPVSIADLAAAIRPVPDPPPDWPDVRILPGVSRPAAGQRLDVMRGEEAQVFGALGEGERHALLCLPGTHSKWVKVKSGVIADFATAMTGELRQVLREHSILGALMPQDGEPDAAAFAAGVRRSGEPGGLSHHLFSVRAEPLFGRLAATALDAYLSGILIGHEIRELAPLFPGAYRIKLVADGRLRALYGDALTALGWTVETIEAEQAAIRGVRRILAIQPSPDRRIERAAG